MTRYNIKGFYGSYGYMLEEDDGRAFVEIIWNGCIPQEPFYKSYKSVRGAKIALSRMLESYTLTECPKPRTYIEYIKNGVTYDCSIETTNIYHAIDIFKDIQSRDLDKITYISACVKEK